MKGSGSLTRRTWMPRESKKKREAREAAAKVRRAGQALTVAGLDARPASEMVHVSTASPVRGAPLHKRGVLDSKRLRTWFASQLCQLAGVAGHTAEPHDAGDPHHAASRGAHGQQDVFILGVCREGHDAAHNGRIPRVEVEAAQHRAWVFFIDHASPADKFAALVEMFGADAAMEAFRG